MKGALCTWGLICSAVFASPAFGADCQVAADNAADALRGISVNKALSCFGGENDKDALSGRIIQQTPDQACRKSTRVEFDPWRRKLALLIREVDASLPVQQPQTDAEWRSVFATLSRELEDEAELVQGPVGMARPAYWQMGNHEALQGKDSRFLIAYAPLVEHACAAGKAQCKEAADLAIRVNRAVEQARRVASCETLPRRDMTLTSLERLDAAWNRYFFEARSQFIWELAVNSARYHGKDYLFGEPPKDQIILLHPGVTFEYLGGGARHERAYQAIVMAELIGYNRIDWTGKSDAVPSRIPPLGASLVATFSAENAGDRIGYGVMVHVYNTLSFGATRRNTGAGQETTWLLSADLMKLVLNPSADAIAKFRGSGAP